MRYVLLFLAIALIACNDDLPAAVPTVESLSCDTPGELVTIPETRGVFAMRAYGGPPAEQWGQGSFGQEGGNLWYECPSGGIVEILVY